MKYTYAAHPEGPSPLVSMTQDIIKTVTWVLIVLLSFRGLLSFYGAKQSSWLEQVVNLTTAPLVIPFRSLFIDTKAGETPVFFSMLCVAFLGILMYVTIGYIAKYSYLLKMHKKSIASTQKFQS